MRNKNRTATIDWISQRDWKLAKTLILKKDCTEHRALKTMRRHRQTAQQQIPSKNIPDGLGSDRKGRG